MNTILKLITEQDHQSFVEVTGIIVSDAPQDEQPILWYR
jgi:hypothetical protein